MSAEDATPTAPPVRLVGGYNFSTWPDLKWARGNAHFATLQARFTEWHLSVPITVEGVLRDDRQTIDLVARIPRGIPSQEWALTIGDAIHNLRSALDAVAWGMANFEDSEPNEPRKVTFPVAETSKQWKTALDAWLGDIDPEFRKRIEALQPFRDTRTDAESGLAILHKLDIQDKHRDFVTMSTEVQGIDLGGTFEYEQEDAGTTAVPRLEMRSDVRLVDGAVLGTLYAGAPVKDTVAFQLRPSVTMLLEHDGRKLPALHIVGELVKVTRDSLDVLLSGIGEEEPPGDWEDLEISSV